MRCPLDHIHGAATARVANWVGGVHPKNVLCASVAFFLDSEVHWLRSVLAWCAFPPAGVSQNAKVLSCVQVARMVRTSLGAEELVYDPQHMY